jgi:hypothetical protein
MLGVILWGRGWFTGGFTDRIRLPKLTLRLVLVDQTASKETRRMQHIEQQLSEFKAEFAKRRKRQVLAVVLLPRGPPQEAAGDALVRPAD